MTNHDTAADALRKLLAQIERSHGDNGTPWLRLDAAYNALDLLRDHGTAILAKLAPKPEAADGAVADADIALLRRLRDTAYSVEGRDWLDMDAALGRAIKALASRAPRHIGGAVWGPQQRMERGICRLCTCEVKCEDILASRAPRHNGGAVDGEPHWSPDCQGKWDYDGVILRVSSRYWPGNYRQDGRPSATSTILDAEREVAKQDFVGDTEAEVKAAVEAWVREQRAALATEPRADGRADVLARGWYHWNDEEQDYELFDNKDAACERCIPVLIVRAAPTTPPVGEGEQDG